MSDAIVFNYERFYNDLILFQNTDSNREYADKLQVDLLTLNWLKNKKKMPTLYILDTFCNLFGKKLDDYFDKNIDNLDIFINNLSYSDKEKLIQVKEEKSILNKYKYMSK